MGEIKPGILALVYGCVQQVHHNGDIVTVLDLVVDNQDAIEYGKYTFDSDNNGEKCAVVDCHGDIRMYGLKNLMPINPEADPLEQTQQQEQTA